MATDVEFLDEVTAFLDTETLVSETPPRKSFDEIGFQQLLDEPVPAWMTISQVDEPFKTENYTSSSSESTNLSSRKNKRRRIDQDQRLKYRQKQKNERNELLQLEDKLSKQVQELNDARNGANTTERTDVVLSKSFWKQVATQQREHRVRVEDQHKRLSSVVNSQGAYIESMKTSLRECPNWCSTVAIIPTKSIGTGEEDQIDDFKWLRLKSSVSALYTIFLQEVDECYARVDQVFRDAEFAMLPIGVVDSSYKFKSNGDVKYFQHRNRLLQLFNFDETCHVMWELSTLSHRQNNREVYHGISDPDNTIGVQFRLQKTLSNGSTVSIMKHVVSRRFIENHRVVIVWKIFSEGEGIFSGMDTYETGWSIIRPQNNASKGMTLMEFCYRQVPVPYLTANANDPVVKDFKEMMENAVEEDAQVVAVQLGKLLKHNSSMR